MLSTIAISHSGRRSRSMISRTDSGLRCAATCLVLRCSRTAAVPSLTALARAATTALTGNPTGRPFPVSGRVKRWPAHRPGQPRPDQDMADRQDGKISSMSASVSGAIWGSTSSSAVRAHSSPPRRGPGPAGRPPARRGAGPARAAHRRRPGAARPGPRPSRPRGRPRPAGPRPAGARRQPPGRRPRIPGHRWPARRTARAGAGRAADRAPGRGPGPGSRPRPRCPAGPARRWPASARNTCQSTRTPEPSRSRPAASSARCGRPMLSVPSQSRAAARAASRASRSVPRGQIAASTALRCTPPGMHGQEHDHLGDQADQIRFEHAWGAHRDRAEDADVHRHIVARVELLGRRRIRGGRGQRGALHPARRVEQFHDRVVLPGGQQLGLHIEAEQPGQQPSVGSDFPGPGAAWDIAGEQVASRGLVPGLGQREQPGALPQRRRNRADQVVRRPAGRIGGWPARPARYLRRPWPRRPRRPGPPSRAAPRPASPLPRPGPARYRPGPGRSRPGSAGSGPTSGWWPAPRPSRTARR